MVEAGRENGVVPVGITNQLVAELLETDLDAIPERARERMQRLFVDTVGTTYGGLPVSGDEFLAYARDVGGSPEAVVLGGGFSTSSQLAAGINAQLARSLDFEETGPGIHIGPSLIHTILAIGQRVGATGAEMLATACVTYEINGRFHYARYDGDIQRHINVCLAMATCRLLGLDTRTTNLAMGLCWGYPVRQSQLLNPPEPKRISQVGMGNLFLCHGGIQAALLASHGYGELPDELERRRKEYDVDSMASSPEPFSYTSNEIQLKPWPSSRLSQGGIQLSLELMRDHGIAVEDIERITVHLPDIYLRPHQYDPAPRTFWEGIYSVQWGTALGILGVEPGHEWFTEERFADPVARNMARRIEIVEDPEGSKVFAARRFHEVPNTVELRASDRTYTKSALMSDILGSPGCPMPTDMLEDKFHRLTDPAIGHRRAEVLLGALYDLTSIADANDLAELF